MEIKDSISLISKIRHQVNRFLLTEMAKHGVDGIGTSHGDILYALFHNPRLTMAEVASRINKDKSTVTALVDKLVRYGYVSKERDVRDTRVVYVVLTKKGVELKPVFEQISHQLLHTFFKNVTDQEQAELLRILLKIHHNF